MRLLLGSASTIKKGLIVFIQSATVKNYSYFAGKYSGSSDYHRPSARFRYFYPRFVANSRVFNCNCETAAAMSSLSQSGVSKSTDFFFRQLFDQESCTYTYLLADLNTKEAIIIDPVIELSDRDAQLVRDLNFNLIYAVNTHMHADHITGTGRLKSKFPSCKSVIAEASGAQADIFLKPGDKITFGQQELEVRATPGHTSGCLSYVSHKQGMVFTGDALLIRGCGRTDFQGGSSETLYDSIHNNVFTLPKQYVVFPAHDYKGQTASTVGEEATLNPRLTKSKAEFIKLMKELNLPYPKKIDVSLPANKVCGLHEIPDDVLAKLQ